MELGPKGVSILEESLFIQEIHVSEHSTLASVSAKIDLREQDKESLA